MRYHEGRPIHDADSHVMEMPGWFEEWMDPSLRDRMRPIPDPAFRPHGEDPDEIDRRHRDPAYREAVADSVMATKGWVAPGAYRKDDRPWALDQLGFTSQLVFTTAHLASLTKTERGDDLDLAYGYARAHNRAMVDFCSADRRLLPACFVPLTDLERTATFVGETIDLGAAALMISSACPPRHGPSHIGWDPLWQQAQDAGVPIVFHVGGGGTLLNPTYLDNGLPKVPDFTGGDGNFTSVSFMAIPGPVMQTLATMIIDGVLERFPDLKIGVIEQGAAWLPGWMRSLDSAAEAFHKNEDRLKRLSLRPSEYVQRQVKATPYPHEPAGWIITNTGPTVCMFSSDYPHTEGGRNPLKRFEAALAGCGDAERDAFYYDNFADLMGPTLDRLGAVPRTRVAADTSGATA